MINSPVLTMARQEWRQMFFSPLAWVLSAVIIALDAYFFNQFLLGFQMQQMQMQMAGQSMQISVTIAVFSQTLVNGGIILLLLIPLITMRLIAGEKQRETWPVLISSPLTPFQIVLGKYLGFLGFLFLVILLHVLLLFSLSSMAPVLDMGTAIAGLIGFFFVGAAFGAIGLSVSCFTENPIVAAVLTFAILLFLWIFDWMGKGDSGVVSDLASYFSLTSHFRNFVLGVINTADIFYFLIVISMGMLIARQRLVAEQING
ncbi:ABC transporter permease subunit [Magnetococcales bacterium HHB-1]